MGSAIVWSKGGPTPSSSVSEPLPGEDDDGDNDDDRDDDDNDDGDNDDVDDEDCVGVCCRFGS